MEHAPAMCLNCPERGTEAHFICDLCDNRWPCPSAEPDCDRACEDCLRCRCICADTR